MKNWNFWENSKKKIGGVVSSGGVGNGVGVRVDVNEELKFWGKFKKKLGERVGGGVGSFFLGGRVRGVRVDVNEELKFL